MSPTAFTDEQLAAVMAAAAPLPPHDRSAFLRDVAHVLQSRCDLGIDRIVNEIQRRYWHPPRAAD